MGLHLPRRLKKRLLARVKQPLVVPEAANGCWSLDFTSDVLTDGRRFRTLNVLDDYNRQLLGVEIDFSLPAARVVQVLARLVECPRPTDADAHQQRPRIHQCPANRMVRGPRRHPALDLARQTDPKRLHQTI